MTLSPGTKLGPYEILTPLGAGGMGEVWKARDARLDRFVAVKVLPEHLARNAEALARFEREAKTVAALNHPNITGIHDFATQGDTAYVVMELLEGESLRTRLEQGPIPPRKAAGLAIQMAQGLAAAHEKGVVHRDLKPDNLWITKEGRLKILDFGLAKQLPPASTAADSLQPTAAMSPGHQTEEGVLLGTLGYMSPEQVRGEKVDARSDIFSFGVVLFEMLTGQRAFARGTTADALAAILKEDPPELLDAWKPVPMGLRRILDHCLEKVASRRFHDAEDLAFALENVMGNSLGEAALALPATPRASMRWVLALLMTTVGLIGIALGRWSHRPKPKPEPTMTQLTFNRGNISTARFTPDGDSVVYAAGPMNELFLARLDGKVTRSLGLNQTNVIAVNRQGELLIWIKDWTLAQVPMDGGTPRELLNRVISADFGPDGVEVAAIHQPVPGGPQRLDFPLGTPLVTRERPNMLGLCVSPKGDTVAFLSDDEGSDAVILMLVDRQGKSRELHRFPNGTADRFSGGPFWSPSGEELYFTTGNLLRAITLSGHIRPIRLDSSLNRLLDVSIHGGVLMERAIQQRATTARRGGKEVDLSFAVFTHACGISANGEWALIQGGQSEDAYQGMVGLSRSDGGSPKLLGPGWGQDLSPDGAWALILPPNQSDHVTLTPTGPGVSREFRQPGWSLLGAQFTTDGNHILAKGKRAEGPLQLLRFSLEGGPAEVLPTKLEGDVLLLSKDDLKALMLDQQNRPILKQLEGGAVEVLGAPLRAGETILGWDKGDQIIVGQPGKVLSTTLELLNLKTGTRNPWQVVGPSDQAQFIRMAALKISPDLSTVVYSFKRAISSDLFWVDGLQ